MNKNLYRIVFNKARGMLMVVPDIAASGLATSSPASGVRHTQRRQISRLGKVSFSILLALGCVSTPAWAKIVADGSAPGKQQPTVINSANGTPQINIQKPSAAGVSHNKYTQFDVDQKGAILNNSHQITPSQIGGMVTANPWLAKGEAKVILNEVNSRNSSQLNGMLEVAGRKAQIVIANPSGITCDGCGFINANRATLTTGQVQMANGQITGYDVSRGTITVQGRGMDSTRQDTTELIARAVKVNASIQARELKITAGRNNVNATDHSASAKADDGSERPQFAVDVAQLGGMYANKIQLRGTETGVGVHNAGTIGASAGDVVVNADGSITNSGLVQASENVQITSRNNITSSGVLAAGMRTDGTASAAGSLAIESRGKVTVSGQNSAVNSLSAKGASVDMSGSQNRAASVGLRATQGDIHTRQANVVAQRVTVSTRGMLNNDGGNLSADKLELSASQLSNRQGMLQQSGDADLTLSHAKGIDNSGGQIVSNSKKLTLTGPQLNNQQGRIQAEAIDISTAKQSVNNQQGIIAANKSVKLQSGGLNNDAGLVQAGTDLALNLQDGALSNRNSGPNGIFSNGTLAITAGTLDNRQGVITGADALHLKGSELNNAGGLLQSGASLAVDVQTGSLTNRDGGNISAKGPLTVNGGALDNSGGVIASGKTLGLVGSQLNNDSGLLQAGKDLAVDVQRGTFSNRNSGKNGGVLSQGTLSIESGALDNSDGFMAAGDAASLNTDALNNAHGTLASDGTLSLTSDGVTNQQGLIQAGKALSLDTRGNTLANGHGEIVAGETLSLLSGALLNDAGRIVATDNLQLTTHNAQLMNQAGTIAAGGQANLSAGALDNTLGQVQAAGDIQITVQQGLENSSGLVRSGQTATVSASSIANRNTNADQRGIEGHSVILNAGLVDNTEGAVRSTDDLTLNASGNLDNTRGMLSTGGQLAINGGQSLALTNSAGTLIAGRMLRLDAGSTTGDGKLLSQDAMALNVKNALLNTGQVIANGNVTFSIAEGLINEGLIKAGGELTMNLAALVNRVSGEISAQENHLLVSDALTNWGLLDGSLTHISAATLNNYSTGRIYGDHVALQAGVLNNEAQDGIAPVIAARQRLDIGVGTLNNVSHALIYSAGDIAIGGSLNNAWQADGKALTFNNHSSTLESAGDMTLNIGEINNLNDNLQTQIVDTENTAHHEAALKGSPDHYDWNTVDTRSKNKYGVHSAKMPNGSQGDEFYEYQFQRNVKETQIVETDPGKIIAGGNMTINSDRLNNLDSRVVAGGLLGGIIGVLNNLATPGQQIITDIGTQTRWYAKKKKKKLGGTKTSQGKSTSGYRPAPIITTIDLKQMAWQSNVEVTGSGTVISGRNTDSLTTHIIDPGQLNAALTQHPINAPAGQMVEIASGPDSVIRMTQPNLRLPDNSLYQLRPANDVPFLIETDPRFTDQRQWLSSDYMQNQFTSDGGSLLKRLGDGFYEQNLIREQVTQLTGNRFLKGFDNDENQYRALMDSGVAFGKQYNLIPGVALTPEQMALLTSDMVWLVKQDVTLPDGSEQSVLVPQVYGRVRAGDLDGSGALMSGNNIALNMKNDLTNSGHITGREVTQITAENMTNNGYLGGNRVSLQARTDINNIGGTLRGGDGLTAVAGHDLNSVSTLSGSPENRSLDRAAGIYVQNDSGVLVLQASNNVNLTGSVLSNMGANSQTQIVAGNDINMNTVTTTYSEKGDWGRGNDRSLTRSTDIGSQIISNSDVTLLAGHDVNTRAATVSAQGGISVAAGHNINLDSGNASYHLTENSHQSSGGLFSRASETTHDEVKVQDATGSTLSGNTVMMKAEHDVLVRGSNVVGTQNVAIQAGNDLTMTTADQTNQEWHEKKTTKSGLMNSGGIGFTVGSRKETTDDALQEHSDKGSMVGSLQGDTVLLAGNNYRQTGSAVSSPNGNVLIQGKNVTIDVAQNTYDSQHKHAVEQKGFTLAVNVPALQALQSVYSTVKQTGKSNDDRVNMLSAANAAWDSARAANTMMSTAQAVMKNGAQGAAQNVSVSLTYGQSKQTDTQNVNSTSAQASKVNAGKNAVIVATGGDHSDINIIGSDVSGKQGTTLFADKDINILAAKQERHDHTNNRSVGWNAGVAASYGQGGASFGVTAGGNYGEGRGAGDEVSWRNSHVGDADSLTKMTSGDTTTLRGGQLIGKGVQITANNLNIESLQDTMKYEGKQMNVSGQVTVGYGFSASGSFSQSEVDADYASVQEQSGVFAGDDGYQINVNHNTNLKGGLITSNNAAELAGLNQFSTGTLTSSDIENRSEFEGKGIGLSGSYSKVKNGEGGNASGKTLISKEMSQGIGYDHGSDSSRTRSGINTDNIVITDLDAQQTLTGKDVATTIADIKTDISTETAAANSGKLDNNFDKDEVFKELNLQVSVTKEFQGNARNQISSYIDGKQAIARTDLKKAMDSNDVVARDKALDEIYKLQYQKRFLETLVGVVAANPGVAITQGTLATAATALRRETVNNSFLFKGAIDRYGNVLSNVSGESEGSFDGLKMGGVRFGLDGVCGGKNERCVKDPNDPTRLAYNEQGLVSYIGNKGHDSFPELLADPEMAKDLIGATGGNQGGPGTMFGYAYAPGSFLDTLVESYGGSHDYIGGQFPGFYDNLGNTSRGRSDLTGFAAEVSTYVALPLATPNALSEMVSPELLQFIFATTK